MLVVIHCHSYGGDGTAMVPGRHENDALGDADEILGRTASLREMEAEGIHIPQEFPITKFPSTPHLFDASHWYGT